MSSMRLPAVVLVALVLGAGCGDEPTADEGAATTAASAPVTTAAPATTAPPPSAPPTTAAPDPCASWCLRIVRSEGEIPALFERRGEWVTPFVLTTGEEVCARPTERPPELARVLPGPEPVWSVRAGDVDVIVQAELTDRSPPKPC
jgi:hypothetical protein